MSHAQEKGCVVNVLATIGNRISCRLVILPQRLRRLMIEALRTLFSIILSNR